MVAGFQFKLDLHHLYTRGNQILWNFCPKWCIFKCFGTNVVRNFSFFCLTNSRTLNSSSMVYFDDPLSRADCSELFMYQAVIYMLLAYVALKHFDSNDVTQSITRFTQIQCNVQWNITMIKVTLTAIYKCCCTLTYTSMSSSNIKSVKKAIVEHLAIRSLKKQDIINILKILLRSYRNWVWISFIFDI